MKRSIIAISLCFALPAIALAQVAVKDPWVRATVAEQKSTGAFMQLTSPEGTRLVEVRSTVAKTVELHEMSMDGGVMKMRALAGVDLPAGKTVELKPGGYHVMLVDLKGQVKAGDSVPLTLVFEGKDKKRETVEVKATARALNEKGGMGSMDKGGMDMMHH